MKTAQEIKAKLEFCKTALANYKAPKINLYMLNSSYTEKDMIEGAITTLEWILEDNDER